MAGNGQNLNEAIRRAVPALQRDRPRPGHPGAAEPGPGRPRAQRRHGHHARWPTTTATSAAGCRPRATRPRPRPSAAPPWPPASASSRPSSPSCARPWPPSGRPRFRRPGHCATSTRRAGSCRASSSCSARSPTRRARRCARWRARRRSAARPSPAPRRRSTCSTSTRRPRRSCPRTCAIILQHLDDPSHAVETDQRAGPQHTDGRKNYTGLEALLQYVFDQSQAINVYDGVEYILKVAAFVDPDCSPYNDGHKLRKDDAASVALAQKCSGNKIGPNGPGLLGEPNISDNGKFPSGVDNSASSKSTSDGHGDAGAPNQPADQPKDSGNSGTRAPPAGATPAAAAVAAGPLRRSTRSTR